MTPETWDQKINLGDMAIITKKKPDGTASALRETANPNPNPHPNPHPNQVWPPHCARWLTLTPTLTLTLTRYGLRTARDG